MVSRVASPRSADPLAPGQRIGPYLLLAPLGAGGSARVWAVARTGQQGFSKRMALKVMRQDRLGSARARQRFDREARLGAQLRHANLRAVHELGSHAGRPHMAMAWVDTSLEELLEQAPGRRLPAEVACWFGIQVCAALEAAHNHVNPAGAPSPIVHGDVSPGNILLTLNGHVLLADLAAGGEPSPTAAEPAPRRSFFGNLAYTAPEALDDGSVDGRADLFSLGCVLYEMLAGAPAFEADDERSLLFQVLNQPPPALAERARELPEPLLQVVQRALERSAAARFASAEEMRRALCACVPALSAFALERLSTELIGKVLGERIREREEQMRATFQRFAATQLETTDTLPIGNTARRADGTTLHSHGAGALSSPHQDAPVSIPGGVVAAPEPRHRRQALWLLAAVVGSLLLYAAWPRQPSPAAPAATAASEPLPAPPSAAELAHERQGLQPSPAGGGGTESRAPGTPSTAPVPPASAESGAAGAPALPTAAAKSRRRRSPPAAPARQQVVTLPSGRKWKPPDNPYLDTPEPAAVKSPPTR